MFGDPYSQGVLTAVGDGSGLYTCTDGTVVPMATMCPTTQPSTLDKFGKVLGVAWTLATVASAVLSGYHGVKRHHGSVGWGIAWFALGGMFPIITPVVAFGQGFAQPM